MHAAAVDTEDRFGHKAGINAGVHCNLLDYQAVGHNIICHGQRVRVAHVDFMLAGGYFVMRIFDTDAHFFQCDDGVAPQVGCRIQCGHIKISAGIQRFCPFGIFEIEELQFRPNVEGEA